MPEFVYRYTGGSNPSGAWTNPSNAWDGVDDTYASRVFPSAEPEDEGKRLEGVVNNAPASGDQITKVEIGVEAFGDEAFRGNMWDRVRPVFGGTILGNVYAPGAADPLPTFDPDFPWHYFNIINDPNAPSPWTWADIQALDMRTWFYVSSKNAGTIYVDQLWIRVTTAAPPAVGYSYGDGLVSVSVLAIMRKAILSVCGRVVR